MGALVTHILTHTLVYTFLSCLHTIMGEASPLWQLPATSTGLLSCICSLIEMWYIKRKPTHSSEFGKPLRKPAFELVLHPSNQ